MEVTRCIILSRIGVYSFPVLLVGCRCMRGENSYMTFISGAKTG